MTRFADHFDRLTQIEHAGGGPFRWAWELARRTGAQLAWAAGAIHNLPSEVVPRAPSAIRRVERSLSASVDQVESHLCEVTAGSRSACLIGNDI